MRFINAAILNGANAGTSQNSLVIDASQIVSASFQIVSSSGSNAGSLQIQFSNDLSTGLATDSNGRLVPTNWSNLGSAVTVTGGGLQKVEIPQSSYAGYRWLRAVWTPSAGAGTITVTVFTLGF